MERIFHSSLDTFIISLIIDGSLNVFLILTF